jgi:hypothetical protein
MKFNYNIKNKYSKVTLKKIIQKSKHSINLEMEYYDFEPISYK